MRKAIALVLALILMWAPAGYTSGEQSLTALLREEPNYRDAVKLLGEPDEERSSSREAYIAYKQHCFCGLAGTLTVGFRPDGSTTRAAFFGMDYARWSAQGGEAEIQQAVAEITAEFDRTFGAHKTDDEGLIWRNENRVKIIVYATKDAIEIAFGCGIPQKLTALFNKGLTYEQIVELLGKPDREAHTDTIDRVGYNQFVYYGLKGYLRLDFVSNRQGDQIIRTVSKAEWIYGDENDRRLFTGSERQAAEDVWDRIIEEYGQLFGAHEEEHESDGDFYYWSAERIEIGLMNTMLYVIFAVD